MKNTASDFIQTATDLPSQIISINPTTEEELGRVITMDRAQIDSKIRQSRNAFIEWKKVPIKKRASYLKVLSDLIQEKADDIAELIAKEQGKTIPESKMMEIIPVLAIIKNLRREAPKILQQTKVKHDLILFSHKKSYYRCEPYGVVLVISPWNFSFSVPIPEIVAALVAGNTVIFKPAPDTIFVGKMIDELFQQAGFPEGVMNTLFINDEDAPYVVEHSQVDKIIFTGSTETGKEVMKRAAKNVTPVLLELGGKDPAVVASDANLKRAAKGVFWGAMFNTGQVCASIERAYVERSVADEFVRLCLEEAQRIKIGDPLDESTDVGPLANEGQLRIIEAHIQDAVQKSAKVIHGGKRQEGKGYFFQPTILTDVDHSMKIMKEETFGPVLPIMIVDSVEEAIQLANDSEFGLSAYGWTSDPDTALKMKEELLAGIVMINDATSAWGEPKAPWGGFKKSGIGRTRSMFGLMEMVQVKYVSAEKSSARSNLWWFPNDRSTAKIAGLSIELLFKQSIFRKIKSFIHLLKIKRFVKSLHWWPILRNVRKLF